MFRGKKKQRGNKNRGKLKKQRGKQKCREETKNVERKQKMQRGNKKCREENNDGEKQSFSVMEIVLGMKTRREKKNQVENNKLRREKLKEGMQK